MISGSFEGGGSTNISGSLTSTGSFGSVVLPDFESLMETVKIYKFITMVVVIVI